MFTPTPETLDRIINDKILDLYDEAQLCGLPPDADLGYTCQAVFGFHPRDVAGIHTHKTGAGAGLWFRLKDGRVIDASTRTAADPDPKLYDIVAN